MRAIRGDARPHYPPVMLEELTGKTVLLVGYGSIGKEIERMLEPFRRGVDAGGADGARESEGACGRRTGCVAAEGPGDRADSAVDSRRRDG